MYKKTMSIVIAAMMAFTVFAFPMITVAGENAVDAADVVSKNLEETSEVKELAASEDKIDIVGAEVVLENTQFIYSGQAVKPTYAVTYDGVALQENTDYVVEYTGDVFNAGENKAAVVIKGINNYSGELKATYTILPASMEDVDVTLGEDDYDYNNGKEVKAEIIATYNGVNLEEGVDFVAEYKNNIYPGEASVKIKGTGNFAGEVEDEFKFSIAKVENFKVSSTGTNTLSFKWDKEPNVTGYKISKYNAKKKAYYVVETIKGNNIVSYKATNLTSGTGYKYKIVSYVEKNDTVYKSEDNKLNVPTAPEKVTLTKLKTAVNLTVTPTWKKVNCTGYQIKISRKSNFSNSSTFTIKSSSALSKTIDVKYDDATYYVKVRAYKTYDGKTKYGAWSDTKKIKTDGTGWATLSGKRYYYKNGEPLKGQYKIGGDPYYFSKKNGVLLGSSWKMWTKMQNSSSGSDYLVAVSRSQNRVCVYKGSKGKWVLKKYYKCTTGAPGSKSPAGYFTTPTERDRKLSFGDGFTCWYATRIVGNVYFHSVIYNPMSKTSLQDGRLGANLSHGCIRMSLSSAKWIYNNIPVKTKVVIY